MENQTPIVPVNQSISNPIIQPEQPKQFNFIVILLSILLFVSVSIAGFFAYQTKKLVKELTMLKNEPTPTSEAIVEPVATVDPTASWKTYTNSIYKYSLNLPKNWEIGEEVLGGSDSKINLNSKVSSVEFTNSLSSIQIFYEGDFDHGLEPWLFEAKKVIRLGEKVAEQSTFGLKGNPKKWFIVTVSSIDAFRIEASIDQSDLDVFDQILSTFKFTN